MHPFKRIMLALLAVTAFALTGCAVHATQSAHPKATAAVSAIAKNPATVRAEAIVKSCITAENGIQLRQLARCIAPAGHKKALESCLTQALIRDGFITKADRSKFEQTDAPECVVNNR